MKLYKVSLCGILLMAVMVLVFTSGKVSANNMEALPVGKTNNQITLKNDKKVELTPLGQGVQFDIDGYTEIEIEEIRNVIREYYKKQPKKYGYLCSQEPAIKELTLCSKGGTYVEYPGGYSGPAFYLKYKDEIIHCIEANKIIKNGLKVGNAIPGHKYNSITKKNKSRIEELISISNFKYNISNNNDYLIAVQYAIWNITDGMTNYPEFKNLVKEIQNFDSTKIIPSFSNLDDGDAKKNEMKWDEKTHEYKLVLTDTNKVFDKYYSFNKMEYKGYKIIPNGNTIAITASKDAAKELLLTPSNTGGLYWKSTFGKSLFSTNNQDLITEGFQKDYKVNIRVYLEGADIEIEKKADFDIYGNKSIALANAKFELSNQLGYRRIATTNSMGKINFKMVPKGNYSLKEIQAPTGYSLDKKTYQVSIDNSNKASTLQNPIINSIHKGGIKLVKYSRDSEGNLEALQGVNFLIEGIDNKSFHKVYTTDFKGELNVPVDELNIGKYKIKEVSVLDNHYSDFSEEFELIHDKQIILIGDEGKVFNDLVEKEVYFKKIGLDSDGNNGIPLGGVQYVLYDASDNEIQKIITDKNGVGRSKKLKIGKYYIIEQSTQNDYIIDKKKHYFEVSKDSDKLTEVLLPSSPLYNKKTTGKFKFKKIGYNTGEDSIIPLQNVIFNVKSTDVDNSFNRNYKTDLKGVVESEYNELKAGNYLLSEQSDFENYFSDYSETFEIKEGRNTTLLGKDGTITNTLVQAKVRFKKIGETLENNGTHSNMLKGAKFKIEVVTSHGNKFVENLESDLNGIVTSSYLDVGTYILTETKAPTGYNLSMNPLEFTVRKEDISKDLFINLGNIQNKVIEGYVQLNKVKKYYDSKVTEPASNVKFGIYDMKNNNLIETISTDKNGFAKSKALKYGEYYAKEIYAPSGLIKSEKIYKFKIDKDQEIVELNSSNKVINFIEKGRVSIHKTDKSGNDLKNAEFCIYSDNLVVECMITSNKGFAVSNYLDFGKYSLREVNAPKSFLLEEKSTMFEINSNNYKEVASFDFINEKLKTNVQIFKIDSQTKEPLKNVEFELYDDKDMKIKLDTKKTDRHGKLLFEDVNVFDKEGNIEDYYIIESKQKKGYIFNGIKYKVLLEPKDLNRDGYIDEINIVEDEYKVSKNYKVKNKFRDPEITVENTMGVLHSTSVSDILVYLLLLLITISGGLFLRRNILKNYD